MNDIDNKTLEMRKRAEDGSDYSQYDLGYHYAFGIDVEQDMGEAVKWWRDRKSVV